MAQMTLATSNLAPYSKDFDYALHSVAFFAFTNDLTVDSAL
jgi:hypothetical protein